MLPLDPLIKVISVTVFIHDDPEDVEGHTENRTCSKVGRCRRTIRSKCVYYDSRSFKRLLHST